MRYFWKIFLTIILLSISSYSFAKKTQELFCIENSLLSSKVQYVIDLDNNYKIDKNEPVYGFWKRPSGSTRELNWFEKKSAYGIKYQKKEGDTSVEIALSKFPEKKITIIILKNKAVPYMMINKKKCILQKVFIKATGSDSWPTVQYAEIIGIDPETNAIISEKIKN